MELVVAVGLVVAIVYIIRKFCVRPPRGPPIKPERLYPDLAAEVDRRNSLLHLYQVNHINAIVDQFHGLEDVSKAIRQAGLESSNLIFGIDYTVSNLHQGQKTYGGRSLHALEPGNPNPYQQVMHILGKTLDPFADEGVIPTFGFGDASTKDKGIFPFRQEGYCRGFEDALVAYNEITPKVRLSGPTNFAPLINQAVEIVKHTKAYHILVIVADGQVTSERLTRDAIVEASKWPLSIIMVGVGDGPWDMMREFDDRLPQRQFDNFQFVNFHRVCSFGKNIDSTFALHALMEVPDQFKAIRHLGLLDM